MILSGLRKPAHDESSASGAQKYPMAFGPSLLNGHFYEKTTGGM